MAPGSSAFRSLAIVLFGPFVDRYPNTFEHFSETLREANINMLAGTWISIGLFATVLSFIFSLGAAYGISAVFALPLTLIPYIMVLFPITVAAFVGLMFYYYPIQTAQSAKHSIDTNLPFALAHMSAVASSGIGPEYLFELLIGFKEYGKISHQSKIIVRNMKEFGMSSVQAIKDVAERTPSARFQEVLQGIAATMEKGGNLTQFLKEMAEKELFDYRIKREKYLKSLSTYADLYTAILVAAPLILLSVLGILNIIGGNVLGFGITDFIFLITWVIMPLLNILFISFIQFTYSGT